MKTLFLFTIGLVLFLAAPAHAQVPSRALETLYLSNHGMCEGGVCPKLKHCRVLFIRPITKQCGGKRELSNLMLLCDKFLDERKERKGCDDILDFVETCAPDALD